MCVCIVDVIAALVMVVTDFAGCCFGGLGWVGARGTTTGTATTRWPVLAACVGRFPRRTSAWTQYVGCRDLELGLR